MIFLNSHGGQIAPMEIVVRDLRVKHKMLTVAASWFGLGMPDGVFSDTENRFGIHAGDMETSVMLALQPESVQMDYAQDFHPTIRPVPLLRYQSQMFRNMWASLDMILLHHISLSFLPWQLP